MLVGDREPKSISTNLMRLTRLSVRCVAVC